jgi:undecaprenyl-diphosphatase
LHKWSEKNLGSLATMAWALLIGGVVMWVVDAWSSSREASTTHVEEMSLPPASWPEWTAHRRSSSAFCSRFPP